MHGTAEQRTRALELTGRLCCGTALRSDAIRRDVALAEVERVHHIQQRRVVLRLRSPATPTNWRRPPF